MQELAKSDHASTSIEILKSAIEASDKIDAENLGKLIALHTELENRAAKRDYSRAFAEFQAECPPVQKTSTAKISSAGFEYAYAELPEIVETIRPYLHKYGFSYSWDSSIANGSLSCICTLAHENGHSETGTFIVPVDRTGKRSAAQDHGAALTYAKRQALTQVLGLTCCDPDTDAAVAQTTPISRDEQDSLDDLIGKLPKDDVDGFWSYMGCEYVHEIPYADYDKARSALVVKLKSLGIDPEIKP